MSDPHPQTTLVAFYGPEKPHGLVQLIGDLRAKPTARLGGRFQPYAVRQIHATIIGLEAFLWNEHLHNLNFWEQRRQRRPIDPRGVLKVARGLFPLPIPICVGGYKPGRSEPPDCFGEPRSQASVVLKTRVVAVKGWPIDRRDDLYQARKSFAKVNVLHKFHELVGGRERQDNDFYFRLETLNVPPGGETHVARKLRHALREAPREFLWDRVQIQFPLSRNDLQIVRYGDPELPLASSAPYRLNDLDGDGLAKLYEP